MDTQYTQNSFPPPPLSRTSSAASISSDETVCVNNTNTATSRRTRKRFTNLQLMMLENLFHQNSHPSREDREAVAKSGGMEIKSVTIWFQNKRQTERKSAANNHGNTSTAPLTNQPSARRNSSPTFSNRSTASTTSTSSSRPSLDRVASRSELRAPAPRTPSKKADPNAPLWDNMPSSPATDPISPPAREYVEFGKKRRTLEWACAAARLAEKDGIRISNTGSAPVSRPSSRARTRERREPSKLDLDVTDDETDELTTPSSTWGKEDLRWTLDPRGGGAMVALPSSTTERSWQKTLEDDDDDEVMKAALALCGLQSRGSR